MDSTVDGEISLKNDVSDPRTTGCARQALRRGIHTRKVPEFTFHSQIGSEPSNTIDVYMHNDKGNAWYKPSYAGYGMFGGKDYFDLLAEINGYAVADLEEYGMAPSNFEWPIQHCDRSG